MKKVIKIIIVLMISLVLLFLIYTRKTKSLAIELSKNSQLSSEMVDKVATITKSEEKIAYLTFDDGPTISATPKILDILKEEEVKATFFVIGKYVEKHPEIIRREYEEGHYIANHGYDHDNSKLYKSNESFKEEVEKTDTAIGKAIGVDDYCSHIFRFPNGYMSPTNKTRKKEVLKILEEMQYTYVDWNCLNNDSVKKYSKQELLNNLKKTSQNKGALVVLMHDTKDVSDSSAILKESIQYLKSEGYEFNNFYDLLSD